MLNTNDYLQFSLITIHFVLELSQYFVVEFIYL
eukprot:UN11436